MVGLIVNANARRVRRDPSLVRRLSRYRDVTVSVTESTEEVAASMQRFALKRARIVAVCGGDGSVGVTLRQLLRAFRPPRPALALLPAGTMSTISANVQSEKDPARVLEQLVHDLRGGGPQVASVTTLLVNRAPCFMFGAAMAARFLQVYYQRGASTATAARLAFEVPLAALFSTAMARRIFEPVTATITADGKELKGGWTLLVASTLSNFGLGVQVTYRGRSLADRFQLVASEMSARRLALQFYRTLRGLPLRGAGHHDLLASTVTLTFDQPQPIMRDGDLQMADRVALEVGPQVDLCVAR